MDIKAEKLDLIHWIAGLTDEETVNKIKSIQQETIHEDIPQWQKEIVNKRLEEYRKNPEQGSSWEEAKQNISKK